MPFPDFTAFLECINSLCKSELPQKNPMFRILLGTRTNLDQALAEASSRIAEIGRRTGSTAFRSLKRDGVSTTRLYDLRPLNEIAKHKENP